MADNENQPTESRTDTQPIATEAGAPFDHADSDVILRSSDNVDFRVFKLLLSLGSPFFKDMFALPQASEGDPGGEIKDGLQVVQVTEGRKVLEMLLLMCYLMGAVDPPALGKLEDVDLLLDAAIKYNIERVEKKAREMLVDQRFLSADPLRVFAIACRHRIEEARAAAKATLWVAILERPYGPELEFISGGQIYRLLQYHSHCVAAARKASGNFTWPALPNINQYTYHYCILCQNSLGSRCSTRQSDALTAILRNKLPNQNELETIFMGTETFPACPYCHALAGYITNTSADEWKQKLIDAIDNAVSLINLELHL